MGLRPLDFFVILIYLVGITLFGARFRKKQKSIKDYFLGGKTVPWWAICLSIVATETSTLTVISTPGIAYGGNLAFIQLVFGYVIARFIISLLFIPQYYKGELYTAYELMRRRFGHRIKNYTASIFLIMRGLAEGVRVFAISIVVNIALTSLFDRFALKHGDVWSIIIITLLTLFYTFEGGMTAVIWTDVIQLCIYIGGTLIAFAMIWHRIPGGLSEIVSMAGSKLSFLDFTFSLTKTYTFWAGIFGGTFLTMASHGTDQLIVQRLLTARNEHDSKKALITSGFVVLFQFSLFLFIGVMLWVFYQKFPTTLAFKTNDYIFPTFVITQLPTGVSGIIVAAILAAAMANLSSSFNSLASTTLMDFYKPLFRPEASDAHYLRLSRWLTVVWGLILIGIAVLARQWGSVLEVGLTIASVTYGALLGIFLMGVLTRSANERGGMIGMTASLITMVAIQFFPRWAPAWNEWAGTGWLRIAPSHIVKIGWPWYTLIGTAVTFALGMFFSKILKPRQSTPSSLL
ncbi:MAG: sodium:solute symporter [Acidobacteriia bacterium]|nr:sodium:solute symporter [Terriglobia bacterium]